MVTAAVQKNPFAAAIKATAPEPPLQPAAPPPDGPTGPALTRFTADAIAAA